MPPSRTPTQLFLRLALYLIACAAAVYLLDFAWYELRAGIPKLGASTGSVHRKRLLAIQEKNNRVEYEYDTQRPEEDVPCSHSLFPHDGNQPCWYVARHANDPISL
jgi:hypothetical protein